MIAAAALAQAPSPELYKGFTSSDEYILAIDGEDDASAQIYVSQRLPGFLCFSDRLPSPVLLVPRLQQAQTVHIMKVSKQANGSVDLLPDHVLRSTGFQVQGQDLAFAVDGHQVVFKQKPPLLGPQDLAGMRSYSPEYVRLAAAYAPAAETMAALGKITDPVKVTVYFGSWCPFCQRYVPRMMRVAQELEGSQVAFDFYGLPRQMSSDPMTAKAGIDGVPTGVVFRNGKEAGRIKNDAWTAPEKAIQSILVP